MATSFAQLGATVHLLGRNPDKAVEASITAGGIAEALEDEAEKGGVTSLRGRRARRDDQLGDSSDPRVSKTS